jgi:hypothetical protein
MVIVLSSFVSRKLSAVSFQLVGIAINIVVFKNQVSFFVQLALELLTSAIRAKS